MRAAGAPAVQRLSGFTDDEPGTSICGVECHGRIRSVVLTYDDGPEPGGTERILETLARREASATFFVPLSRVRRCPGLFADAVAAGHEIGLRGLDHQRLTAFTPAAVQRRTTAAKEELEDALGRSVRWFRPPYGIQSAATWGAVTKVGLTPVLWTTTLEDWLDIPTRAHLDAASAMDGPGAIVLAHDGFATTDDGVDDGPAPHLDRGDLSRLLLDRYAAMDLVGCSLGRALESGPPREADLAGLTTQFHGTGAVIGTGDASSQ
jgi:peptidoglycan/xylan/chitin deacetylase (PgdA/CDA1 family)